MAAQPGPLLSLPGRYVALAHTSIAATAFAVALSAGYASGNWEALCTNSVARWPVEWFPSVSATVGDHAASRAPFHIIIALCATPRFVLLGLQWLSHRYSSKDRSKAVLADIEVIVGISRTFCCGSWMYITSRDNHNLHDLFMILYLLLTLPWMLLSTKLSVSHGTRRKRLYFLSGFLFTIPPLVWQYYKHSVLRNPGAYTYYSFFEWSLVFWDVGFDAIAGRDVVKLQIQIVDPSADISFSLPAIPPSNRAEVEWAVDSDATGWQRVWAYLSDVTFAMCFWTVFTSLTLQLFYWSVWELALAGSELALLANISPLLLRSDTVRIWTTSREGLFYLRCFTVVFGMGFFIAPIPVIRLLAIVIGTSSGWLAIISPLIRAKGTIEAVSEGQILLIGLSLITMIKYVNQSINPFWAVSDWFTGGWNITGLLFSALSLYEFSHRSTILFAASAAAVKDKPAMGKPFSIPVAVGLGSVIHLLQTFATDAGTIIAWTWTGFPVKGPTLFPFGGLVISAMCLGSLVKIPLFLLLPAMTASAAGLYTFPDWIGFWCGLVMVASLMAVFPEYFRRASACNPGPTFGVALLVYCIWTVISVVTTAYAFVPLGHLVRERTDLVLGGCVAMIIAGLLPSTQLPIITARSAKRLASVEWHSMISAVTISALGIAYGYYRLPGLKPIQPYFPEHRIFTGGIWAVHFGVDLAGRDSQRRMRDLIRDMQVDVVGLIESDLHRGVYGNRDLTRVIADDLGYYVDIGPGPNKHTWGAALLSKFPILNSTHHLLPSPRGELAPAIHATLDIHGQKVNVFVSHNGQEEDPLDRELQTIEIARLLRETEEVPTVFLGYLVTKPGALRPAPYQILMEDGKVNDIEKSDKWRWCEYIAFRGLWRIAFARVHESDITDTELQVGKFILPKPDQIVSYENDQQMYWHIGEEDIPEPWRMPRMFRDEGVRGHKYEVWIGPLYYMPPPQSGLQRYGWDWSTEFR